MENQKIYKLYIPKTKYKYFFKTKHKIEKFHHLLFDRIEQVKKFSAPPALCARKPQLFRSSILIDGKIHTPKYYPWYEILIDKTHKLIEVEEEGENVLPERPEDRQIHIKLKEIREEKKKVQNAKQWTENNSKIVKKRNERREENKTYQDEYREKNVEKLTEKFQCGCGGKYSYKNKATHEKTSKHLKWIESLEN